MQTNFAKANADLNSEENARKKDIEDTKTFSNHLESEINRIQKYNDDLTASNYKKG